MPVVNSIGESCARPALLEVGGGGALVGCERQACRLDLEFLLGWRPKGDSSGYSILIIVAQDIQALVTTLQLAPNLRSISAALHPTITPPTS